MAAVVVHTVAELFASGADARVGVVAVDELVGAVRPDERVVVVLIDALGAGDLAVGAAADAVGGAAADVASDAVVVGRTPEPDVAFDGVVELAARECEERERSEEEPTKLHGHQKLREPESPKD